MWQLWYYLYYKDVVSLTTLSVQLRIYATNCMAKCIHPVVQEAGVKANLQKFWFVENPRKIPENWGKISENPNKSLIYLDKIPENLGKNGANVVWLWKMALKVCRKNKWRPFLLRSHHKTGRQKLHDNFLGKFGNIWAKSSAPPNICLLLHLYIHPNTIELKTEAILHLYGMISTNMK